MSRRAVAILCAAAGLGALAASPQAADALYGNAADDVDGAQLVSADYARLEQGDDTTVFSAISGDGRYVAIQTRARNFFADDDPDPPGQYRAGGVFRFDLETRALEKVADGDLFRESDNSFVRRGASNPSISFDGRYVAFATAEPLIPADTNDNVDVYVRDMEIPIGSSGAFDLVSARDGGDAPAGYGPPAFPFPGSNPGADVSRGVAISADGQEVAFQTTAPSDLPASPARDVPAGQVFVRDRAANTTTLVTSKRDARTGAMTGEPAGGAFGAALSSDGTTVAWTGNNAPEQTRFLGGENADPTFDYFFWRRIADGPDAQTRRVTGLADPDDSACPPGANTSFDQFSTGPCYGPLTDQESNRAAIADQLPALSGDGYTVAFLTGSGPRPEAFTGPGLDLYVTDMTPGLSRKDATVELTRDTVGSDPATSPALNGIAISSSGRYVALTSGRTRFALPALQFLGSPRAVPGPRELYVADLQERTLERVTHSTSGGDIDGDVLNGVSISADGARVAFTSFAGNLFFGDANQRVDAFVATRRPDPEGGPPETGPGDDGPAGTIEVDGGGPQIGVRAQSKAGGEIVLTVSVPAAGGVKAVARARAGEPRKLRTLATKTARAVGEARSAVRLVLHPVSRYRAELRERESIPGHVVVTYVAARGGRRAGASAPVVFRQVAGRKNDRFKGRK
jgi:Tol biopolymer transport system component